MRSHVKKTQKRPQTSRMHQNFPPMHLAQEACTFFKAFRGDWRRHSKWNVCKSNFPTCFGYSGGVVSDPQIHCWDPAAMLKSFNFYNSQTFLPPLPQLNSFFPFQAALPQIVRCKVVGVKNRYYAAVNWTAMALANWGNRKTERRVEGQQHSHLKEEQPTAGRLCWLTLKQTNKWGWQNWQHQCFVYVIQSIVVAYVMYTWAFKYVWKTGCLIITLQIFLDTLKGPCRIPEAPKIVIQLTAKHY